MVTVMTVTNKLSIELATLEKLLREFKKDLNNSNELTVEEIYRFSNQRDALLKKISFLFNNKQELQLDKKQLKTSLELSERIDGLTVHIVEQCQAEQDNIKILLHKVRKGKVALKGYSGPKKKIFKHLNLSG